MDESDDKALEYASAIAGKDNGIFVVYDSKVDKFPVIELNKMYGYQYRYKYIYFEWNDVKYCFYSNWYMGSSERKQFEFLPEMNKLSRKYDISNEIDVYKDSNFDVVNGIWMILLKETNTIVFCLDDDIENSIIKFVPDRLILMNDVPITNGAIDLLKLMENNIIYYDGVKYKPDHWKAFYEERENCWAVLQLGNELYTLEGQMDDNVLSFLTTITGEKIKNSHYNELYVRNVDGYDYSIRLGSFDFNIKGTNVKIFYYGRLMQSIDFDHVMILKEIIRSATGDQTPSVRQKVPLLAMNNLYIPKTDRQKIEFDNIICGIIDDLESYDEDGTYNLFKEMEEGYKKDILDVVYCSNEGLDYNLINVFKLYTDAKLQSYGIDTPIKTFFNDKILE